MESAKRPLSTVPDMGPSAAAPAGWLEKCAACNGVSVTLYKAGADTYAKMRQLCKHGLYHEIKTPEATLQFNLNGEIVRAQGRGAGWPSSLEWLKRTAGNDWVYYSTGGYAGTYETLGADRLAEPIRFRIPTPYNEIYKATGEFYLPNLPYPSNAILGRDPFEDPAVAALTEAWPAIVKKAAGALDDPGHAIRCFLRAALDSTPERLQARAEALFAICGGRIAVLPPDTRHVDYNVLPVRVARGCLYQCGFCRVKSGRAFTAYDRPAVERQIRELAAYFGAERVNCNALLLAGNDALHADKDLLLFALDRAMEIFAPQHAYMQGCSVFLFGSVESLLAADERFFEALQDRGCRVFVNIGLESADAATLAAIGKPITAERVKAAFRRMQTLNERWERLEISANFLMDDSLPAGHWSSFAELAAGKIARPKDKGTLYFSPLCRSVPSQRSLFYFNQLQAISRPPAYLYLIQRL